MQLPSSIYPRFPVLRAQAGSWVGSPIPVALLVGEAGRFPNARDYAVCARTRGTVIIVAPKFRKASMDRREAVLRHELGHAVWYVLGSAECARRVGRRLPPEALADELARLIWGQRIRYDAEAVQTLQRGGSRSAKLPA